MRFLVYLITFLSLLTVFVSGVFFWMCIENGLFLVGHSVMVLVLVCFTAILGSAIYRRFSE